MQNKFKRGNLVKILYGHWLWDNRRGEYDARPQDVGREAIIDHASPSCAESYSVIWKDTGYAMAWKDADEMELIDEGGEHLFKEAEAARKAIEKRDTNIHYIWEQLDNNGVISSTSMLYLFKLLGYNSRFLITGEYFQLHYEWNKLYPIFVQIKNANTVQELDSLPVPDHFKVLDVWRAFHTL